MEEFQGNDATGLEYDPESEPKTIIRPYDPRQIRVDPKVYSLHQILDMIDEKELDLAPDFQRRFVWQAKQKSLLIEFYSFADTATCLLFLGGCRRASTSRGWRAAPFNHP